MKVSAECFAHLHRLDSVVDSWQHPRSPGRGRGRSWCPARSWCWCRAGARCCCCCSLYSRCYSHSRPGLALPAFSYPLATAGIWRLLGSVPPRCNRPLPALVRPPGGAVWPLCCGALVPRLPGAGVGPRLPGLRTGERRRGGPPGRARPPQQWQPRPAGGCVSLAFPTAQAVLLIR